MDMWRVYQCIKRGDIVLSSGTSKKTNTGHVWIVDGIQTYVTENGSLNRVLGVHCNWGWDEYCYGWYTSYNRPDGNKVDEMLPMRGRGSNSRSSYNSPATSTPSTYATRSRQLVEDSINEYLANNSYIYFSMK